MPLRQYHMNMQNLSGKELGPDGQARILRVAYPLFVEQGYKLVLMQQIADSAHIHKATLYHHFRNKDAIFIADVLMALRQIRIQVSEVVNRDGTASEVLFAGLRNFLAATPASDVSGEGSTFVAAAV